MLIDRFFKYVNDNELIGPDDRVLLTVSGGVDSMVMLALFAQSGFSFGVAHCNFQLRGAESEEDEVLVEREAAKYGVPFYNKRFDTAGEMERTGESVQIAARRLRYEWFDELSREHGYTVVAIAHHADDSIETFFINLFRGTGLRGLTGIHNVNGKIIRPLLFASRKEIMDYAHANHIPFREDSSNRSTKYLRNRIRLGLIPRMREIHPRMTELMSANIRRLTDAQTFINRGIEMIRGEVERREGDQIIFELSKIDHAFPVNFVIYELLVKYGFKGDVIDNLCRSLVGGGSGKRFYARDYVAYIDRGQIILLPIAEEDPCAVAIEKHTTRIYAGNSILIFEYLDIDNIETLSQPQNVALLDAEKLSFPMEARRWSEGDSFTPFGMSGTKKVSDYLIDAKVPLPEKRRQFVITEGDKIVWLVGHRIDERYKITPSSETVLKITKEII